MAVRSNQSGFQNPNQIHCYQKPTRRHANPREISHVTNGIIFCVCLSHFSSTNCSEVMSKRAQKDSGEERVTAKSKPMMNLVSRCSERTPAALSSTASESPEKTRHESQFPLSSRTEQHHRKVRPVVCAHSSSYSEWNIDRTWSSLEWKSDDLMNDCSQHTDQFVIKNDETNSFTKAESELSSGSRLFLHMVDDQVQKRQKQSSKDATKDGEKRSLIWKMFMSSTLRASVVMEKNYSDNWHPIKNTEDLTMKQMFDISEKLISEQSDEIYGVKQLTGKNLHRSICLGLVMKKSSVSCTQRSTYFQILYYALER